MLQEIRANSDQISMFLKSINNYSYLFNDSGKPGYSGTGLYYLNNINIKISSRGTISPILEQEGRVIEFQNEGIFYLNVYTPNGNSSEERLNFKLRFYKELQEKAVSMYKAGKKVIIGGDFNVAHTPKDLYAPKTSNNSGYLECERNWFTEFLREDFIDSFRMNNKEGGNYTWWHMKDPTRKKNKGWRYDYFLVSKNLGENVKDAQILKDVFGSDHCPIMLEI
jgi:exodeoxyribonuclease-3